MFHSLLITSSRGASGQAPHFFACNRSQGKLENGRMGAPAAPIAPKKQPGGRRLRPGCLFLGKPPSLWLSASCQGRLWGPPREGFQGRGVPPLDESRKGAGFPAPYQSPGGTGASPGAGRGGPGERKEKPGGRRLRPGCLFLGKPPSLWLSASCQGRLWGPPREGFQGRGVPPLDESRKGAVYPPPYQSPGGTAGPPQARRGRARGEKRKAGREGPRPGCLF